MKTMLAIVCCMLLGGARETPDEIELTSGEVLRGTVIEQTAETIIVEHDLLGLLEIPAAAVKVIRQGGAAMETPPPPPAELPPAPPEAPTKPAPPPKPRWKSTFSVGSSGNAGVSEDYELRLGFNSEYDDPRQHYTLRTAYYYDSSQGDKTNNEAYADLLAAWPLKDSPRWSWFINPRYDFDEFQSWKHRLSFGVGLNYLLFDIDRDDEAGPTHDLFELHVHGGLNARREWGSANEDIQPELLLGASITWNISDRQSLTGRTSVFPDLDDRGEFRTISRLNWTNYLDKWSGVALNFGLEHEYQSANDPGVSPNDLKVFASLGLTF